MSKKMMAMAVALCAAVGVQAGILFQDDFSGPGTNDLNGMALDVNNQDSQTWRAAAIFKADGSVSTTTGHGAAWLDFTPAAGHVYTLKTTITANDSANTDWLAFGFVRRTDNLGGAGSRHSNQGGYAWGLHMYNKTQFFVGPNAKDKLYDDSVSSPTQDYSITLDVTDANNILLSYSVGGTVVVNKANVGTLNDLDIAGVGFSHDAGGNSTIGYFELIVNSQ